MTTTSANISGAIRPFGGVLKRQRAGNIYDIDELTPTGSKKPKRKKGVMELLVVNGKVVLKEVNFPVNGFERNQLCGIE